jgi:hypothetical protein
MDPRRVPLDRAFSQHGLANALAVLAARLKDPAQLHGRCRSVEIDFFWGEWGEVAPKPARGLSQRPATGWRISQRPALVSGPSRVLRAAPLPSPGGS